MSCVICDFFKRIAGFSDTHAVLSALLMETRKIASADAGTIYLAEGDELLFSAAQNDTLFPHSAANKFSYMNSRISINTSSVAGYVAVTGKPLNIADAYNLPEESEYEFNKSFDERHGYKTGSILAVPIFTGKRKIRGVLQLINSTHEGEVQAFTSEVEEIIKHFGEMISIPLDRSFVITQMIMRMLRTTELRDPHETGSHVRRVGSMAAELYHHWAESRGIEPEELLAVKGQIRLAAMLHDVGKVGVPDAVLKKPGKLTDEERVIMQTHAAQGAGLFIDPESEIDLMAQEIALHHHAKWDGTGYTGSSEYPTRAGSDIPLAARITAIVDVYDALVSKRCYKEAWDNEKALEILRKDSGSHFDPELVEHFIAMQEVTLSIYKRYGE